MSFSSNFLNLIIDSNCDLSIKSKYLDEGRNFGYFSSLDNKQVEPIKQKINSFLSLHNKRLEGLLLLNKYLEECQNLLILSESISWATFCLQSSTNKNPFEKQLAFVCLNKIFNAASVSPEIYRMLSGTIVTQFIELLPQMKIDNADNKTAQEFAKCLEICLKTFKGPCSSRKKIIEDFILNLSSSSNFILLARSFALLAFAGVSKQLQTNNRFSHFIINCIYSLDTLLDANLNETHQLHYYSYIKESPFLTLNSNLKRMEKSLDFLNKFKFLSFVIQHLLEENFDGQVKIEITLILNLIQRVISLKVDRKTTSANLESILNSNIIPSLHINALLILNQLITTCSTNLSTNLKEINKILMDLLDNLNDNKSYLIETKSLWYKVVSNWFNKLGGHLIILVSEQWQELIVQNFFENIKLKENKLELQNLKQQKNERLLNTKFSENLYFSNEELVLCLSACQTMDSFLINFSKLINPQKFHKFIYQLLTLIQDLYRIDLYRKSTYFIDPKLRLNLLKVFRNCLISFPNTSLLNNAINLLTTVLKLDKSSDVQLFAKETLIILNFPKSKVYYSVQNNTLDSVKESDQKLNTEIRSDRQVPCLENNSSELLDQNSQLVNQNILILDQNQNQILNLNNESYEVQDVAIPIQKNNLEDSRTKSLDQILISENQISNQNDKNIELENKFEDEMLVNEKSSDRKLDKKLSESTMEMLTNKQKIDFDQDKNAPNDSEDKFSNFKLAEETLSTKRTKSRIKSLSEDIQPISTRLTRSSIKKKLEEENNEQKSSKKVKIQSDQVDKKSKIDEDSEGEVEKILKDFVDI